MTRYTLYLRGGGVVRVELPEGAVRVEGDQLTIAGDLPRSLSADQLVYVDPKRIEAVVRHPGAASDTGPAREATDPIAKLQELAEDFFGRRMR